MDAIYALIQPFVGTSAPRFLPGIFAVPESRGPASDDLEKDLGKMVTVGKTGLRCDFINTFICKVE